MAVTKYYLSLEGLREYNGLIQDWVKDYHGKENASIIGSIETLQGEYEELDRTIGEIPKDENGTNVASNVIEYIDSRVKKSSSEIPASTVKVEDEIDYYNGTDAESVFGEIGYDLYNENRGVISRLDKLTDPDNPESIHAMIQEAIEKMELPDGIDSLEQFFINNEENFNVATSSSSVVMESLGESEDWANSYKFSQLKAKLNEDTNTYSMDWEEIGTINIAKNFIVKSITIKTVEENNVPEVGFIVGQKYLDLEVNTRNGEEEGSSHAYLLLDELASQITTQENAQEIQLTISESNILAGSLVKGSISLEHLSERLQTILRDVYSLNTEQTNALNNIDNKFTAITNNLENKDRYTIKKLNQPDGDYAASYQLYDNVKQIYVGTPINISKNFVLNDAFVDTVDGNKFLVFSVNIAGEIEPKQIYVSLSELFKPYSAETVGREIQLRIDEENIISATLVNGAVTLDKLAQDVKDKFNDIDNNIDKLDKDIEGITENYNDLSTRVEEYRQFITNIQDGSKIEVVKISQGTDEYASIYEVRQDGKRAGVPITIPKDYFCDDAIIGTCQEDNVPAPGLQVGDKYIDLTVHIDGGENKHLYIPVNSLAQVYTAERNAAQIQVAISEANVISATIVPRSITEEELQNNAVTRDKIADGAVESEKIRDKAITEEKLARDSVSEDKLKDESVTLAKLSPEVIAKIGEGGSGSNVNTEQLREELDNALNNINADIQNNPNLEKNPSGITVKLVQRKGKITALDVTQATPVGETGPIQIADIIALFPEK